MQRLIGTLLLVSLASCGGENGGEEQATPSEETQPAMQEQEAAGAPTGTVHEVKMVVRDGQYLYEPDALTIKVGDSVRWANVSDIHNVSFWADSIPDGAADVLNAAMPNTTAPLVGPILLQPNTTYEISFAGAPVGDYRYYCTPHLLLGMVATLTVEE